MVERINHELINEFYDLIHVSKKDDKEALKKIEELKNEIIKEKGLERLILQWIIS